MPEGPSSQASRVEQYDIKSGGQKGNARIDLIDGKDRLEQRQVELYDWIVESRGSLVRPFQVLLHVPGQAEHLARLGHVVRYESGLSGADRELAILATGKMHGCGYIWETHTGIALQEGTRAEALSYLDGGPETLTGREEAIVEAVRSLCSSSSLPEPVFSRLEEEIGTEGVVELCVLVGYYTLLGYTMGAFDVCSLPD